MPIIASDIKIKGSGAKNLGGPISANEVSSAVNGLFDVVSGTEALNGAVEYRCVYVQNTHATLILYNAAVYIQSNTPSESTTADIGVGAAAISATETAISNEGSAPAGVSFGAPETYESAFALGDLAPGDYRAVWIRRTVSAGAASFDDDGVTLAIQGDTAA